MSSQEPSPKITARPAIGFKKRYGEFEEPLGPSTRGQRVFRPASI